MASIASGLFKSLPKPKYTGEEEELPQHAQPRGPRVVGADQIDETQVVLRVSFLFGDLCYSNLDADYTLPLSREPDLPPTVIEEDGAHAPPKILVTAARSPRF
jgi:hypothetical protein